MDKIKQPTENLKNLVDKNEQYREFIDNNNPDGFIRFKKQALEKILNRGEELLEEIRSDISFSADQYILISSDQETFDEDRSLFFNYLEDLRKLVPEINKRIKRAKEIISASDEYAKEIPEDGQEKIDEKFESEKDLNVLDQVPERVIKTELPDNPEDYKYMESEVEKVYKNFFENPDMETGIDYKGIFNDYYKHYDMYRDTTNDLETAIAYKILMSWKQHDIENREKDNHPNPEAGLDYENNEGQIQWAKMHAKKLIEMMRESESKKEIEGKNKKNTIETEEDRKAKISNAKNFEELFSAIEEIGTIDGTKEKYSPEELKQIINQVRNGDIRNTYVTRTYGLRDKVVELLENQKAKISNAKNFEELFSAIEEIGTIDGTKEKYSPEELKQIIDQVRHESYHINFVTRAYGLRDKVKELLGNSEEKIKSEKEETSKSENFEKSEEEVIKEKQVFEDDLPKTEEKFFNKHLELENTGVDILKYKLSRLSDNQIIEVRKFLEAKDRVEDEGREGNESFIVNFVTKIAPSLLENTNTYISNVLGIKEIKPETISNTNQEQQWETNTSQGERQEAKWTSTHTSPEWGQEIKWTSTYNNFESEKEIQSNTPEEHIINEELKEEQIKVKFKDRVKKTFDLIFKKPKTPEEKEEKRALCAATGKGIYNIIGSMFGVKAIGDWIGAGLAHGLDKISGGKINFALGKRTDVYKYFDQKSETKKDRVEAEKKTSDLAELISSNKEKFQKLYQDDNYKRRVAAISRYVEIYKNTKDETEREELERKIKTLSMENNKIRENFIKNEKISVDDVKEKAMQYNEMIKNARSQNYYDLPKEKRQEIEKKFNEGSLTDKEKLLYIISDHDQMTMRNRLNKVLLTNLESKNDLRKQRSKKIDYILQDYIQGTVNGSILVKDALNTAMVFGGGIGAAGLRGAMYGIFAFGGKLDKSALKYQKEYSWNKVGEKMKAHQYLGDAFKTMFLETYYGLSGKRYESSFYVENDKLKKHSDVRKLKGFDKKTTMMRAWGELLMALGMGTQALSGIQTSGASVDNMVQCFTKTFTQGNVLENMKDNFVSYADIVSRMERLGKSFENLKNSVFGKKDQVISTSRADDINEASQSFSPKKSDVSNFQDIKGLNPQRIQELADQGVPVAKGSSVSETLGISMPRGSKMTLVTSGPNGEPLILKNFDANVVAPGARVVVDPETNEVFAFVKPKSYESFYKHYVDNVMGVIKPKHGPNVSEIVRPTNVREVLPVEDIVKSNYPEQIEELQSKYFELNDDIIKSKLSITRLEEMLDDPNIPSNIQAKISEELNATRELLSQQQNTGEELNFQIARLQDEFNNGNTEIPVIKPDHVPTEDMLDHVPTESIEVTPDTLTNVPIETSEVPVVRDFSDLKEVFQFKEAGASADVEIGGNVVRIIEDNGEYYTDFNPNLPGLEQITENNFQELISESNIEDISDQVSSVQNLTIEPDHVPTKGISGRTPVEDILDRVPIAQNQTEILGVKRVNTFSELEEALKDVEDNIPVKFETNVGNNRVLEIQKDHGEYYADLDPQSPGLEQITENNFQELISEPNIEIIKTNTGTITEKWLDDYTKLVTFKEAGRSGTLKQVFDENGSIIKQTSDVSSVGTFFYSRERGTELYRIITESANKDIVHDKAFKLLSDIKLERTGSSKLNNFEIKFWELTLKSIPKNAPESTRIALDVLNDRMQRFVSTLYKK